MRGKTGEKRQRGQNHVGHTAQAARSWCNDVSFLLLTYTAPTAIALIVRQIRKVDHVERTNSVQRIRIVGTTMAAAQRGPGICVAVRERDMSMKEQAREE